MASELRWRKSTQSDNQGGHCVEVTGTTVEQWRKAAHSDGRGTTRMEAAGVARVDEGRGRVVAVRDSKDPDGPTLAFSPADWRALSSRIKSGAFDLK